MHLLWMKTELLHPIDKGGRIRTYQMLCRLARRHEVTYLCLDDGQAQPEALARAFEYCQRLICVPFARPSKRSIAFARALARSTVDSRPYAVLGYDSARMRERVAEFARTGGGQRSSPVDVVVCDFLAPTVNLPEQLGCPVVLFQHNVESAIWRRRYELARNPAARILLYDQWRKVERYERQLTRRVDRVVAVSEHDAHVHRSCYGVPRVDVVPTGVDLDYFRPRGGERRPHELLFLGSLDWDANQDAVRYFVREVLPRVRVHVPATLTVVGRQPPPWLRAQLARHEGVELVGEVDDVRPYLERCALFVVPLRIGGGTRLKIFEAMAMAAPVVSTTIGAEGLPLTHGRELWMADEPRAFADSVIDLLSDRKRAAELGARGASTVRRRFGWDHAAAQLEEVCAELSHTRGVRAA